MPQDLAQANECVTQLVQMGNKHHPVIVLVVLLTLFHMAWPMNMSLRVSLPFGMCVRLVSRYVNSSQGILDEWNKRNVNRVVRRAVKFRLDDDDELNVFGPMPATHVASF